MNYDIFNGDADGICALIQLRLAKPVSATLVTGIKRDIQLLKKIDVQAGDQLTVLDISLKKNIDQVTKFLAQGAKIFYADHHQAGAIPEHPALKTLIDTHANTCTSLIINQYLEGQYPLWAITAAYGDNLQQSAEQLASTLNMTRSPLEQLKKLGTYINYNGYGSCLEDLHFAPDQLYQLMSNYPSPLDFISDNPQVHEKLSTGYTEDMRQAAQMTAEYNTANIAVYILPNQGWARRVSGVFSNNLANLSPNRAHAVLSLTAENDYQVSVRAPLNNKIKADELCASFPTGGGRKAAAGINHLPLDHLELFIQRLTQSYMI
ncbi:MAG: DHH family phosphoesterase [Methyloprofundus sp.]|nr:DHH family phosphoesterase [Methyloprofundus sp.]